jgi:putative DNA primase/helicase
MRAAGEVKPEPLQWLWPDFIPMTYLTIVDGRPGDGKTTMLLDLAAKVSSGAQMPDGTLPKRGKVLLLGTENNDGSFILPRLITAGADLENVYPFDGDFSFPGNMARLEWDIAQKKDVRLVVIDPLLAFLESGIDANDAHQVQTSLRSLTELARRTGAALVGIRHFRKGQPVPGQEMERGLSSIGFMAAARSGLHVERVTSADKQVRRVRLVKANEGAVGRSWKFRLEPVVLEGTEIKTIKVQWEAEGSYVDNRDQASTSQPPKGIKARMKRKVIHQLVRQHPGLTEEEIQQRIQQHMGKIPESTVRYHLKQLLNKEIERRQDHSKGPYRHYPITGRPNPPGV